MNIDVLVLIIIGAFFAFTAYRYGKSYLTAFILAFYPAYFLFDVIKEKVSSNEPLVIVGIFIAAFVLMMYILRRNISSGYYSRGSGVVSAIILSLGALAQCAFAYYVFLPQLSSIYNLSGAVDNFFNATLSVTILAIIPFAALLISARD